MKRSAAALLAALMLLSGCSNKNDSDFPSETENPNAVFFNVEQKFSEYFPPYDYPTEDGLPMMKQTGAVSLKESFAENEERFRPLLEEFAAEPDITKRREITGKILSVLCNAEDIPLDNELFSKRELKILRDFWSTDPDRAGEEIPEPEELTSFNPPAAYLNMAYSELVKLFTYSLICSLTCNNTSYIKRYTDENGGEYPYTGFFNRHLCYGYELGEMSEREFRDSLTAVAVLDRMKFNSPQLTAEFYAYAEDCAKYSKEDSPERQCVRIAEEVMFEVGEDLRGSKVFFVIGDENNNDLGGWDNGHDLLIGGKGDDILDGYGCDDFLIGGEGDDTYVIGAESGNDTIFDCGGYNLIRFEDVSNVYAVGFAEDTLKNDVKLCFGGEFVIIKDFLHSVGTYFDVEINGRRIAYDSPENPLSGIHEPGYVPDAAVRPR